MPKIPFRRTPAADSVVLDAYIPSQAVDYTILPPLENDDAETKFGRLPVPVRIVVLLLPLALMIGGVWALWSHMTAEPVAEVVTPPSVSVSSARVVSSEAIMIEAQALHIADGTPVQAHLLVNDQPVDWIDPSTVSGTVEGGRISMRLQKQPDAPTALDPESTYQIHLKVGGDQTIAEQQTDLMVPLQLASAFFMLETPTPEPTPEPTREPSPQPSATAAAVDSPPTLQVKLDATLLISPTLGTSVIGSMAPGTTVVPLMRTDDGAWFLVRQSGEQVGWLNTKYVTADAATLKQIPSVRPAAAKVVAGPLTARVYNGGNIRYFPDKRRGTVLGQLHAQQTVTLTAKTADGMWYRVVAPDAEGWAHVSLLTIPRNVAAQVAVAK